MIVETSFVYMIVDIRLVYMIVETSFLYMIVETSFVHMVVSIICFVCRIADLNDVFMDYKSRMVHV